MPVKEIPIHNSSPRKCSLATYRTSNESSV